MEIPQVEKACNLLGKTLLTVRRRFLPPSRKVFNNSGLLDTALSGLGFVLFFLVHTHTKEKKNQLKEFH